jgi:hypothetical protein
MTATRTIRVVISLTGAALGTVVLGARAMTQTRLPVGARP